MSLHANIIVRRHRWPSLQNAHNANKTNGGANAKTKKNKYIFFTFKYNGSVVRLVIVYLYGYVTVKPACGISVCRFKFVFLRNSLCVAVFLFW